VHDPAPVRGVERLRDLRSDLEHLFERQRPAQQTRGQRLALQQLQHEVVRLALAADVEERADVRVAQRRDRLRLALEPRAPLLVLGELARQHLDRHAPIEPRVFGAPHLAHAAGTDRSDELVGSKTRTDANRGSFHRLKPSADASARPASFERAVAHCCDLDRRSDGQLTTTLIGRSGP
jgi:hypothetical protein